MDNTLDILAHANDAVCAVNDEKRVVYWNAAAEKMLGITADEAAGQPCWKLLNGKTIDGHPFCAAKCPIQDQIDAQEPIEHFDLWVKNKEGHRVLTNFSFITVPRQNGHREPDQAAIIHLIRRVDRPDLSLHQLRIKLLGPVEVWRADGTKVSGKYWHRAKVRGLFVFLALQRGKPSARETITQALWPEEDHATALRNLNTAVYNLRRSLEPDLKQGNSSNYVFYEAGYYWLGGSQSHWLDVDAFRLGIEEARLTTAVDKAIHHYQKALALYRDDYLADLMATTGIGSNSDRAQLRRLNLDALEEIANLYQQQEEIELARSTYLKILALDPQRQNAFQQLAHLSHGTNTLIDNVAYCQRLVSALKNELDLILNQDLGKRPSSKT